MRARDRGSRQALLIDHCFSVYLCATPCRQGGELCQLINCQRVCWVQTRQVSTRVSTPSHVTTQPVYAPVSSFPPTSFNWPPTPSQPDPKAREGRRSTEGGGCRVVFITISRGVIHLVQLQRAPLKSMSALLLFRQAQYYAGLSLHSV